MAWYWMFSRVGCRLWRVLESALVMYRRSKRTRLPDGRKLIRPLLEGHFRPAPLDGLTISERKFPFRVRADLQRAIDRLFAADAAITASAAFVRSTLTSGLNFAGPARRWPQPGRVGAPRVRGNRHRRGGAGPMPEERPVVPPREGKSATPCSCPRQGGTIGETTGMQFQVATANTSRRHPHHPGVLPAPGRVRPQGRVVPGQGPLPGTGRALLLRRVGGHHGPQAAAGRAEQVILPREDAGAAGAQRHPVRAAAAAAGRASARRRRRACCSTGRRARARRTRSTTWPGPWRATRRC